MIASNVLDSSSLIRKAQFIFILLVLVCSVAGELAHANKDHYYQKLKGTVEGNGGVLSGFTVSLYATEAGDWGKIRILGTATSNDAGKFEIHYRLETWSYHGKRPILYVLAEDGPVMLASTVGEGFQITDYVVVNERTTVATGMAFAQFIHGRKIQGNTYGMINAVKMVENMANPKTGKVSEVLFRIPNGTDTDTYRTFNSLTNVVASCVSQDSNCLSLFAVTTPLGGAPPTTVLQAMANLAKYPWYPGFPEDSDDPIFVLSLIDPINQPALTQRPTSWLLFLKFTGGFYSQQDDTNLMNGPGNIALDKRGFAWINDNYVPKPPIRFACAGLRLLKFYPWGKPFPGTPYFGGGLSGAGFGITLDPRGKIWVGNFGFEAPSCADGRVSPDPPNKIPATHNSVSLFLPQGIPLSPSKGFTKGNIFWPQATISDKKGNIWVANCGNDTVTFIPKGNSRRAKNFPLPLPIVSNNNESPDSPKIKPFGMAIDPKGRAWVTGNKAEEVYRVSRDGIVLKLESHGLLSWPMGISGDSKGNMWVSNSDSVNVPCVDPLDPQEGGNPSIVMFPANGDQPRQFKGGGMSIPWGNAVDGNDTLWVFNFGHNPLDIGEVFNWPVTALSHFCGTGECPAGLKVGDPISPTTGYRSNALGRITGGAIDLSGNIWLMNNWKRDAPVFYDTNPGGNSIVIIPGAATPVKTPLIGPPQSFDKRRHLKGHKHRSFLGDRHFHGNRKIKDYRSIFQR